MILPSRILSFFLLFFFIVLSHAREASLYSSSVSYCSPPDAILIQQFDARYFKDNSSLVFDIVASTVLSDLNVTAKINLNAYGMEPVDLSFNLCEVSKALCPLPLYNFSGAATVPIPAIREKIPDIAYVIPDLEAAATLQLVRIGTNDTVACVQTTLSNGWSTRQRPVGWLVGGLFIFTLAISAIFTFTDVFFRTSLPNIPYPLIPSSLAAFAPHPRMFISTTPLLYRFLTLLFFLQHIVLTSMLDLNYPLLYRSFALNFSWSFGLFASNPRSHLQRSIFSLRSRTGSNNTDDGALAPLEYTSRNLSPYNGKGGDGLGRRDFYTPPTVIQQDGNALSGGITLYSNSLGIAEGNAFLSLFLVLLFIVAVSAVAVGLGYLLVRLVEWVWLPRQPKDKNNWTMGKRYLDGVKAIGARVALGLTVPIFVLVLFQWTLGDSWLAVLLSVFTIVALFACLAYSSYLLVKVYRHHAWSKTTEPLPYPLLPYTEPWATHRWFATIALLVPILILKSAFTSFAKSSGFVQVIAFIIMDGFTLALIFVFKPGKSKSSDVLEAFIAFVRLVTSCCLVTFVETVKVKPIPRYSTAGVAVPRASSDFMHSDSTHVGSATGMNAGYGHGHHNYHHYPSVVLEGDEKERGNDAGSISASTMVSDIRTGFVRGEL
ncbi:hypothetical protein M407DRAFT_4654 [Tulasnella calospora MUT 4182]|uniref:ML-like domain-containing protein n=1 Tax=Tulasnella calospora MUT 4182 TaxID=1051891 RepID=A0A0C3QT66_9AGAM|nr:hypothetical protein M407DRAFT_4654 [Tulasnella calospora MUT 4182]